MGASTVVPMASLPVSAPLADAAEAFAAIALAAVACDGELAGLEARALRRQLEYRRPFCDYSDAAMVALLDRLLQGLRNSGCDSLVSQAAPLLKADQRETAFAVAAELTQADHVETGDEQAFLQRLADQLAIDPARRAVIIDVINVLNRDTLAG